MSKQRHRREGVSKLEKYEKIQHEGSQVIMKKVRVQVLTHKALTDTSKPELKTATMDGNKINSLPQKPASQDVFFPGAEATPEKRTGRP